MKTWQHKHLRVDLGWRGIFSQQEYERRVMEAIDRESAEGWGLVCVVNDAGHVHLYFKREASVHT